MQTEAETKPRNKDVGPDPTLTHPINTHPINTHPINTHPIPCHSFNQSTDDQSLAFAHDPQDPTWNQFQGSNDLNFNSAPLPYSQSDFLVHQSDPQNEAPPTELFQIGTDQGKRSLVFLESVNPDQVDSDVAKVLSHLDSQLHSTIQNSEAIPFSHIASKFVSCTYWRETF